MTFESDRSKGGALPTFAVCAKPGEEPTEPSERHCGEQRHSRHSDEELAGSHESRRLG
jgi:hypothetical protein